MTKKHFEIVAKVLKDAQEKGNLPLGALAELSTKFANEFKKENPRFDTVRFLKAIGFVDMLDENTK